MRGDKSSVGCEQRRFERLCESNVHRIPSADGITQLPRAWQQQPMAEALARPRLEVLDRLRGRSSVESAEPVLAPNHAEDFNVDDVRGRVVLVERESLSDRLRVARAD